jgi:hypothetical protein
MNSAQEKFDHRGPPSMAGPRGNGFAMTSLALGSLFFAAMLGLMVDALHEPTLLTNGFAPLGKLVRGILLCAPVCGVVAILCAVVGVKRSRDPQVGGKTKATIGLTLAVIGIAMALYMALGYVGLELSKSFTSPPVLPR